MSERITRRQSLAAVAAVAALLAVAFVAAQRAPRGSEARAAEPSEAQGDARPEARPGEHGAEGGGSAAPLRVVSLNPSLTAILLVLGAGESLVGVDSWSHKQRPEVAELPDVGGLFDPSLEGVVALEPDLVVLVPSVEQRDFRSQLERLGIRVAAFENTRFDEVLANILDLGVLVHKEREAQARVAAIQATRAAVAHAARSRARVRCLVVLQRDPVFVVGGASFIDEMLQTAGCANLGRALGDGYPRAALEWVVSQAPDVVIDTSTDAATVGIADYWQRWQTLPAVKSDRVLHIDPERFTLPGPALDEALLELAAALHGKAVASEIAAALAGSVPRSAPNPLPLAAAGDADADADAMNRVEP